MLTYFLVLIAKYFNRGLTEIIYRATLVFFFFDFVFVVNNVKTYFHIGRMCIFHRLYSFKYFFLHAMSTRTLF